MKSIISKSILLTIFVTAINFGFKIYLSYHISKDKLGIFYTLLDLVSIVALFFTGYKDSMIKVYSEKKFFEVYRYIVRNYLAVSIASVLVLLLLYNLQNNQNKIFSVYLLLLFFIATQISNFYSYLNVAYKNYNSMLYEKSIKALSLVLSFVILSKYFDNLNALIVAYILQMFIHTIYIYITSPNIFFMPENFVNIDTYKKFMKNYLLATVTSFLGSISIYMSAIIMLYFFNSSDILSEYQVVVKSIFFALVAIFAHPVASYTFPEVSRFISENRYYEVTRMEKVLQKYLLLMFLLILVGLFFTKTVIGLIFPVSYQNSYKLLNLMLPFLPFIIYTSFLVNILKGFDRFDLALWVRVIGNITFFIIIALLYLFGLDEKSIIYSLDISFLLMFFSALYFKGRLLSK